MMGKLVLAVLKMCTVNFPQLALVQGNSNFKRIQRFRKGYRFCQRQFIQFVWSFYGDQGQWVALSMDRTNWKFDRVNINILPLDISWRGRAILLIWILLDKRGNSNQQERMALLKRLLSFLNASQRYRIRYLLIDREFVGKGYLSVVDNLRCMEEIRCIPK